MNLLIANIELVIVMLVVIAGLVIAGYQFLSQPSNKKKKLILTWLLQAVINAEKMLGSNTGKVKLSYVYDQFIRQFPILSKYISKEIFSNLVDETLVQMRHLIETNEQVRLYIKGENCE